MLLSQSLAVQTSPQKRPLSTRGGGKRFTPATFVWKKKKNRPKRNPCCLIPWLLVVFTRQLEILVTAQALVVQKVDGAIDRINLHPVDSKTLLVSLMFIHWIVIYPMDNAIHLLNNCCLVSNDTMICTTSVPTQPWAPFYIKK